MHSNKLQYKETSLSLSVYLYFFSLFTGLCSCCVHLRDSVHTSRARQRSLRARYLEAVVKQETVHYYGLTFPFSRLSPITLHNSSVHSSFRSLARARITLFRKTRRRYVKVSLSHQVELYRRRAGRARCCGQPLYDRSIAKCLNDSTVNTVGLMSAARSPGPWSFVPSIGEHVARR